MFSGEKSRALEWGPDGEVQKGSRRESRMDCRMGSRKSPNRCPIGVQMEGFKL